MNRFKISILLGGAVGCLLIGCVTLVVVALDYWKFNALPPLAATQEVVETLRDVHYTDLRFLGTLAIAVVIIGIGLAIEYRSRKKRNDEP